MSAKYRMQIKAAEVTKSLPVVAWSRGAAAFLVAFLILHSSFFIQPALATDPAPEAKGIRQAGGLISIFGREAGFTGAPKQPEVIIGEIIQAAMALTGVVFGILIVYGGYLWMIARGNEETVKKAIGILQTAIIGFIVTASAYAITSYVIAKVIGSAYG